MLITGVTAEEFAAIVERISRETYAGNAYTDARQIGPTRVRGRVLVKSSRDPGARVSASGRRLAAACWHLYRDVIAAVYEANKDATVRTGVAVYRGRDHFRATFEDTATHNVGSVARPVCIIDACPCEHDTPEDFAAFIQKLKSHGPYGMSGI